MANILFLAVDRKRATNVLDFDDRDWYQLTNLWINYWPSGGPHVVVLLTLIEPRILFIESVANQRIFFFVLRVVLQLLKIPVIRPFYASGASLEADYPAGGVMNARARPSASVDTNNVRTWSRPHQEDDELVSRLIKAISIQ